jgi:hypothetical protein
MMKTPIPSDFVIPCSVFCGLQGQQTGQLQNQEGNTDSAQY